MFCPKLPENQRREASEIRARLTKALEPNTIGESPKLASLIAKRAELTAEIEGTERGAGDGNFEESASLLANRREQLRLVESQIAGLKDARERAEELARKASEEELGSLCNAASRLLIEIAQGFEAQHRQNLEQTIAQYATSGGAQPETLVALLPWFTQYIRNIRAFGHTSAEPAQWVTWLEAALRSEDFLMEPRV